MNRFGQGEGLNQGPIPPSSHLTTNGDYQGRTNRRHLHNGPSSISSSSSSTPAAANMQSNQEDQITAATASGVFSAAQQSDKECDAVTTAVSGGSGSPGSGGGSIQSRTRYSKFKHAVKTFGRFLGPGFMIAVAYIDPGNYATDIAAGATYRFKLLFVILLSNIFAIVLQSLAIKLGTVTGMDLASACRAFLPRWLNYVVYALAEMAIIATDIAEVIGTAIALNLLIPQLPLVAACAVSIVDVMFILVFYRPHGAMQGLRSFELFVCVLVLGVVICFCIQLSLIKDTSVGQVFKGYLPSHAVVESEGLYQACGILGATVMPHSLFLGSGIVQPRLREYDTQQGLLPPEPVSAASSTHDDDEKTTYVPSHAAIKHSLKYSITEVALSLFTFALFVNSAILIVAGASLYQNPDALNADIFGIHDLLSQSISPGAGTIFALALLLSGVSAGIVCTIAGQMISEGALRWKMKPWMRRLITRSISILPSIVIAAAVGKDGLNAALTGSQVALSCVLPFVTLPLVWFTCRSRYMTVQPGGARFSVNVNEEGRLVQTGGGIDMANSWLLTIVSGLIWLVITAMNVANLVLLGMGKSSS